MRADTQPFGLLATTTGEIAVQALDRQKLKPDEVEIQVLAWRWSAEEWSGLAAAVGQPAVERLLECAGIVSAVGSEVTDFAIGQEVVAWGCGATVSHAIAPQALVAPKPPRLSAAQAATLPIAGLSAYYALVYCARLQPGDRVLVHCAADPIGIASIQIARMLGAALTVSVETPEQQAVLDRLGLPAGRDQPADGFALIVDTSSGAYVQRRLELLRPHGALFVLEHPYKALVLHHSAHPRMKNSRLTRIDPYVLRDDIGYGGTIFRDAMALIASAGYGTATLEPRTLSQLVGQPAIRQSSSSAVIAIDHGAHLPMVRMPRTVITPSAPGTYLLAGDFSAPQAALASWLFAQGIYDQAWFSPGAPTGTAIAAATTLRNQGARIVCKQVVLTDTQALAEALSTLAGTQPPLRGVIYLPQLDEAESLLQLDPRRFNDKCATVILSAWNLHTLASSAPLEHFILYASTASILGAPQQAPQAAASAFLGSLAHYRRGRGLPGMAINWWGWEADDYAESSNGDTGRRAHHGMRRIAAQEGVRVLEHVLRMQPIQATVLPFMLRQWLQYYPKLAASTLFKNLSTNDETAGPAPAAPSQFRAMLLAAPNDRHIPMLEEHLFKILRQILRLPSSTLDRLTPFGSVGLDSLMAMEFRNILEDSLSIDFPVTLIWNHRSIAGLAEYLSSQLVGPTPANSTATLPPVADAPNELAALLSAINDLSLEEFQHMLDNDPLA